MSFFKTKAKTDVANDSITLLTTDLKFDAYTRWRNEYPKADPNYWLPLFGPNRLKDYQLKYIHHHKRK